MTPAMSATNMGSHTPLVAEFTNERGSNADGGKALWEGLDTQAASSDDDSFDKQRPMADEVCTALGVSIGREQTRLASLTTPAEEKAAAIEEAGGFFVPAFDGGLGIPSSQPGASIPSEHIRKTSSGSEPATNSAAEHARPQPEHNGDNHARLPSPWWPDAVSHRSRTSLIGALFNHRRARSGSELAISIAREREGQDNAQPSGTTSESASIQTDSEKLNIGRNGAKESASQIYLPFPTRPSRQQADANAAVTEPPGAAELETVKSGRRGLARSASDDTLRLARTLSLTPSLGDDKRFENVQSMVNNRTKAIRDTWRDSRFGKYSFKPDFLRDKSGAKAGAGKVMDPMTAQPYQSVRQAAADTGTAKPSTHPHLMRALDTLEGDIVILGGYRGSVLRSGQPPFRQLWIPVKAGLNLRKVDLELGIAPEDDEKLDSKVFADGMLTHIGPIDISRRLFKRLRSCENARQGKLRVHDYGYDWRLDPTFLSRQFIYFLEGLDSNKRSVTRAERGATVIAHSLGGLIARHAINQRPDLFNGIIYAGTPNHCVNILGPLRNGDDVLLSSRILTAQVNFTVRTSFALLPLDGRCFIDIDTKEEYPVDFFDPQSWLEYRLSPCVARPLPPLNMPEKTTSLSSYVNHVTNALPSLPLHKRKDRAAGATTEPSNTANSTAVVKSKNLDPNATTTPTPTPPQSDNVATAVTLDPSTALAYLTRILPKIKAFKLALAHNPSHTSTNSYPPAAVIYGKSVPTVYGAKVRGGREGIKRADAYDNLAFASGDGVVLARAAMVPEGYEAARGGVVSSERGHVTLLGDLEAVGKALWAVQEARRKGVGLGVRRDGESAG